MLDKRETWSVWEIFQRQKRKDRWLRERNIDSGVAIRTIYGFGYQLLAAPLGDVRSREVLHHSRLADIARGHPAWAEALLHARALMGWRDVSRIEAAAEVLRSLVIEAPRYMPARLLLAENLALFAHWHLDPHGDLLAEAKYHLALVRRHAPGIPGLASMMGHLHDIERLFNEASALHRRAVVDHPDDPTTHYLYGIHLDLIGQPQQAVTEFDYAVSLNPHSVNARLMLVRQKYTAGDVDAVRTAMPSLKSLVESDPTLLSTMHSMNAYVGVDSEGAEQAHHTIAQRYIFAESHLSYLFARRGEREKALHVIESAGRSDPGRSVTFVPTLLKLGLFDEAMRRAEAADAHRVGFLPGLLRKPENAKLAKHRRFTQLERTVFGDLR